MKQVHELIERLRSTSSSKEKNSILSEYKEDKEVKLFLYSTLEPSINYYQTAVEDVSPPLGKSEFTDQTISILRTVLASRILSGDAAVTWLNDLYASINSSWGRDLLKIIIDRDLKCGVGVSSINKVWPGFITQVPYMRCSLPKDAKLDDFPWATGVISQVKADGMYALIDYIDDNHFTVRSRAGSPFPHVMFNNIMSSLEKFGMKGQQYQGELLVKKGGKVGSSHPLRTLPREQGNGVLNSILKGGSFADDEYAVFHVWDTIPSELAVSKAKIETPYQERFNQLMLGRCFLGSHEGIDIIESKIVYSYEEAYNHFLEVIRAGGEGTIVKHPEAPWIDGTSKFQVKMKTCFCVDLQMVDLKPGEGKHAKTFGSVLCKTSDELLDVGVSGFTDKKRQEIFDSWDSLKGKIMSVTANNIMYPTKDNNKYSLFLPRFTEIRLDKNEADSLQEVIDQFESTKN